VGSQPSSLAKDITITGIMLVTCFLATDTAAEETDRPQVDTRGTIIVPEAKGETGGHYPIQRAT